MNAQFHYFKQILSRDSVTVAVDAVVYYRVQNPTIAVSNVENFRFCCIFIYKKSFFCLSFCQFNTMRTATRPVCWLLRRCVTCWAPRICRKFWLSVKTSPTWCNRLLTKRPTHGASKWSALKCNDFDLKFKKGTQIEDVICIRIFNFNSKDVRLPVQLQRAMAAEAEAAREARAKVIAAEGEQKASKALKEAADIIAESPSALQVIDIHRMELDCPFIVQTIGWRSHFCLQLRYLQTLNTIASEKNSTVIFPLPMDIISHFMKKNWALKCRPTNNRTGVSLNTFCC